MAEFLLLLFVRFGMPVALLFFAGFLAHRIRSRSDETFEALMPAVPAGFAREGVASHLGARATCWEVKQCTLAERDKCPAYTRLYLPCWLAKQLAAGGHIDVTCLDCTFYEPERAVNGLPPRVEPVAVIAHPATTLERS